MRYSKYVGRVGALAVALGVGSALAGGQTIAWAEPGDASAQDNPAAHDGGDSPDGGAAPAEPAPPESVAVDADGGPAPSTTAEDGDEQTGSQISVEVAPGVVVSHSGGAQKSSSGATTGTGDAPSRPEVAPKVSGVAVAPAPIQAPAPPVLTERGGSASAPSDPAPQPVAVTAVASAVVAAPSSAPSAPVARSAPVASRVAVTPEPLSVWSVLAAVFGSTPVSPAQSPAGWVLLAAARRQLAAPSTEAPAAATFAATAVNSAPADPTVVVGAPNASTGVVTGTVVSTDPDGDAVTYSVPPTTAKGSVSITRAGVFTYTPTAAARHAAAAVGATTAKTDTFTVTVSDGKDGVTTKAVTVSVLGRNNAPTGYANVGWPNTTTGVVTGNVATYDADWDRLSYSAANTAKGTVSVTGSGAWTYTPTAAARHAAAALNAPAAAKQDTFAVTVSDGFGGVVNIPVTVSIVARNSAPTNPTVGVNNPDSSGVVTGTVGATDADGDALAFSTPPTTSKGAVTINSAGVFTYTPTAAARRAAAVVNAPAAARTDTFTVTITDGHGGSVTKAVTVTVAPRPNAAPNNPTVSVGAPNSSTGVVKGTAVSTDPDGDTVTYSVPASTAKGTVSITGTGAWTYTPTAAARHAAAAIGATTAKTDTFTVTVRDGYGGVTTKAVTVDVLGRNTAPGGYANIGWPNTTTGVVAGTISASDADYDPLTYRTANTTKGTVSVTGTGAWTYTPTAAARHAAAALNAPAAAKTDTFTVTVSDGYGGSTTIPITVTIVARNSAPTNPVARVTDTHLRTGVATGTITAGDADGDTFTYTSTTSSKGSLTIGANGAFTYTPTLAARQAATATNAPAAAKIDTFTVGIADGHGGTTQTVLTVPVTALNANSPLTGVTSTVQQPNSAIGVVTGTINAVDPEGDRLTYTVTTGPGRGSVSVDAATGAFSYTPTTQARYQATVQPGQVVDSFTVRVSDAYGASTSLTVSGVPIAGYAAHEIDQRPTSVGISDPYLFYATQTETDEILSRLRASGVDTVRIHVPWAHVETEDDVYDWSAVDRMVNSARAHDMTVIATLNHTPEWAVTEGLPALSGAPADPQEYADFAGTVAARYAGRISAYEVWNEPNGRVFWEPGPDAAAYTALLKAAYPAIKAADPNATVVAGSVGFVEDIPGESIDAVRYVQQMYANGAAGHFDALAFHPYHYWSPFTVEDPEQIYPRAQLDQIHQLMVANGDGEKLIWATEYGQTTLVRGEEQQAAFLADFLRAWRDISYAGPAYLYTTRDGVGYSDLENSFGLYREDWTPKPALDAVADVIEENLAISARSAAVSAAERAEITEDPAV